MRHVQTADIVSQQQLDQSASNQVSLRCVQHHYVFVIVEKFLYKMNVLIILPLIQ